MLNIILDSFYSIAQSNAIAVISKLFSNAIPNTKNHFMRDNVRIDPRKKNQRIILSSILPVFNDKK
jgi:hypothetical protein